MPARSGTSRTSATGTTGATSATGRSAPALNGALLSPRRLGDVNRSRVLQAFCDYGPMSRADLARMAGVTRATIGNIVQDLIDVGMIEEHEPRTGTGRVGKPARPLWFAPRAGLCGAATLSPDGYQVALVNGRGEVLEHAYGELDANVSSDALAAGLASALRSVLPSRRAEVLGIGVAVPGVVDTASGTIIGSGQLRAVRGTTLVESLARRLRVRVLADNDARAQALGEKWFGAGRGLATFASVQTGQGLGVGLVLDGVVYRGERGEAGEAGHTCVVADGGELCRCGLRGCWETIATLGWLRSEARRLGLPAPARLGSARLVALAADDREPASRLLSTYADHLAIGLANLVQTLAVERLILHGDVVGGGEPLRSLLEERTRARVLGYLRDRLELVLSPLDQQAGLLGAAGLVLSETFRLAT